MTRTPRTYRSILGLSLLIAAVCTVATVRSTSTAATDPTPSPSPAPLDPVSQHISSTVLNEGYKIVELANGTFESTIGLGRSGDQTLVVTSDAETWISFDLPDDSAFITYDATTHTLLIDVDGVEVDPEDVGDHPVLAPLLALIHHPPFWRGPWNPGIWCIEQCFCCLLHHVRDLLLPGVYNYSPICCANCGAWPCFGLPTLLETQQQSTLHDPEDFELDSLHTQGVYLADAALKSSGVYSHSDKGGYFALLDDKGQEIGTVEGSCELISVTLGSDHAELHFMRGEVHQDTVISLYLNDTLTAEGVITRNDATQSLSVKWEEGDEDSDGWELLQLAATVMALEMANEMKDSSALSMLATTGLQAGATGSCPDYFVVLVCGTCAACIALQGWAAPPCWGACAACAYCIAKELPTTTPNSNEPYYPRYLCFPEGTLVHTPDGLVPIEQITSGESVRTLNLDAPEASDALVARNVTKSFGPFNAFELIHIHLPGDVVTSTPAHEFWTPETRTWTKAEDLQSGQLLQAGDGQMVLIERVERVRLKKPVPVYTLSVDELHHFMVGKTGTVAANKAVVAE